MGDHLQADLSTRQLIELSNAARTWQARDPDPAHFTVDDLLALSSAIKDPRIPLTVARAAGRCGLMPMGFTGIAKALMS